jgi:hypothetical protein
MGSFASKSSKPQDDIISSVNFVDKLKKEGHTCVIIEPQNFHSSNSFAPTFEKVEEDQVSWCHQKICKYRQ